MRPQNSTALLCASTLHSSVTSGVVHQNQRVHLFLLLSLWLVWLTFFHHTFKSRERGWIWTWSSKSSSIISYSLQGRRGWSHHPGQVTVQHWLQFQYIYNKRFLKSHWNSRTGRRPTVSSPSLIAARLPFHFERIQFQTHTKNSQGDLELPRGTFSTPRFMSCAMRRSTTRPIKRLSGSFTGRLG